MNSPLAELTFSAYNLRLTSCVKFKARFYKYFHIFEYKILASSFVALFIHQIFQISMKSLNYITRFVYVFVLKHKLCTEIMYPKIILPCKSLYCVQTSMIWHQDFKNFKRFHSGYSWFIGLPFPVFHTFLQGELVFTN